MIPNVLNEPRFETDKGNFLIADSGNVIKVFSDE